ncbi:MAG TPA: hypothetical protein QF518_04065 [Nitrosopumilus sp.]|jgi:hypothetical protein|nr:hypothetical protein [Nitrososphaerota archaeon]MDP6327815.1 hypothetical protein [Nitrosopumilus sp.]HJM25700.1 hypothetical protein [Nitrosopumilus sp.]HJO31787.1 hypothetical protein [Nitrosopumilus sp.]|tara:strand:+ start:6514 stop:6864 length:351 start_codon:yes stop_codon:yes gene_type:complete
MTEFVHKPYEKIYVRDMIKLSLDDLIGMMSSLDSANAYWVDGVLFASFAMTESEELAKKEMQDQMYLDKIVFAVYEKYSKTVKSSTNLEIGVLNMQKSKLYKDLIKWLKVQSIWNE